MIRSVEPYSKEKNLVKEYNREMKLTDSEYLIFRDHDAMWTTYNWHNQITNIVKKHPECGCFAVMTNRCSRVNTRQLDIGAPEGDDIKKHRSYGKAIQQMYYSDIIDITKPVPCHFSAINFVLSKKMWKLVEGFKPYFDSNILGIDTQMHQDLYDHGQKIYLMKGVYCYHWYKGGVNDRSHLK